MVYMQTCTQIQTCSECKGTLSGKNYMELNISIIGIHIKTINTILTLYTKATFQLFELWYLNINLVFHIQLYKPFHKYMRGYFLLSSIEKVF